MALYHPGSDFLFSVDTRVKWVGVIMIAFIVLTIPLFTWAVYILLFAILVALSISSRLPFKQILKRTLLVEVPLLFILIPLPFINPSTATTRISLLGLSIDFSLPELLRVGVLLLRSWLIIFSMVVLTVTTPADELLASLSSLGVPAVLVTIILLMWRYLVLFVSKAKKLSAARELRSALPQDGNYKNWHRLRLSVQSTGSMLGGLFLQAYEQSDRVYQAMQLRGFDGTLRSRKPEPLRTSQWVQIFLLLVFGLSLILGAYGIYGK